MLQDRFNLIEKLEFISNKEVSKDSSNKRNTSFNYGDIPEVFRKMYNVANSIASQEGLIWIQVKHTQNILDRMQQSKDLKNESIPPLIQTQLLDFVTTRREEYLQIMIKMFELYIKSIWIHESEKKN